MPVTALYCLDCGRKRLAEHLPLPEGSVCLGCGAPANYTRTKPMGVPPSEPRWTASDVEFLRGMRIAP